MPALIPLAPSTITERLDRTQEPGPARAPARTPFLPAKPVSLPGRLIDPPAVPASANTAGCGRCQ